MPNNESERGGSHEQHVKAGQQSHKNQNDRESTASGEGRGWHGDPEGHAEAGRKGGEAVSQDRGHMAEIGREGGESRGQGDQGASNASTGSRGGSHEQHVKAGRQSHKNTEGQSSGSFGGTDSKGGSHEQHVKAGQQSHKNR